MCGTCYGKEIKTEKVPNEAQLNINNTSWKERIFIQNISLQNFKTKIKFDLIVSNPPFFPTNDSNERRDIARHTNCLSFEDLVQNSIKILALKGVLAVIIPKYSEDYFCKIAEKYNLYCNRTCYIRGNKFSEVKRVMMEFSFIHSKIRRSYLTVEIARHQYTAEYINLCKDFYLGM